jgi:hypothetical protein
MKREYEALKDTKTEAVADRAVRRPIRVELHLDVRTPILVQPSTESLSRMISRGLGRLIATHILSQTQLRDRLMVKTNEARRNKNSTNGKAIK